MTVWFFVLLAILMAVVICAGNAAAPSAVSARLPIGLGDGTESTGRVLVRIIAGITVAAVYILFVIPPVILAHMKEWPVRGWQFIVLLLPVSLIHFVQWQASVPGLLWVPVNAVIVGFAAAFSFVPRRRHNVVTILLSPSVLQTRSSVFYYDSTVGMWIDEDD